MCQAERILIEALKQRRWQEAGLAKRAKGDLGKVPMAGRLREETRVTVNWLCGAGVGGAAAIGGEGGLALQRHFPE